MEVIKGRVDRQKDLNSFFKNRKKKKKKRSTNVLLEVVWSDEKGAV